MKTQISRCDFSRLVNAIIRGREAERKLEAAIAVCEEILGDDEQSGFCDDACCHQGTMTAREVAEELIQKLGVTIVDGRAEWRKRARSAAQP